MKQYPSIDYFGKNLGIQTIAFNKLDGSNLRFEYSKKKGFYKFGTRQMMIDANTELFGKGVNIFLNKYSEELNKIFRQKEYRDIQNIVCFAEFVSKNGKFGQHDINDEFDVVLFDVDLYKKGFIEPKEFIKNFGHLHIPEVVYEGNLNKEFYQKVFDNKVEGWENRLTEGVVCKSKINKGFTGIFYTKIKTSKWLEEVKERYGIEKYKEELR